MCVEKSEKCETNKNNIKKIRKLLPLYTHTFLFY